MQRSHRLQRELAYLMRNPSEGISCCPKSDDFHNLTATIMGPSGSPYQGGIFYIQIHVSERYPFEPPRITFQTPVYHPNIDDKGRICMDVLKMPPKGGWKPTITIKNLLDAIQYLLANPNPDDPLIVEIAEEYRINREKFEQKAKRCVLENARNRF